MAAAWLGISIALLVIVAVTAACIAVMMGGRAAVHIVGGLRRWLEWRHVRRIQREHRADLRKAVQRR